MRLLNRNMELGLNIMQLMSTESRSWSVAEIGGQLKESELFTYQVLRILKTYGYVVSTRGAKGGYTLTEHAPASTLSEYVALWGRDYQESITARNAASEAAGSAIKRFLRGVQLADLFGSKVLSHPNFNPPGVA